MNGGYVMVNFNGVSLTGGQKNVKGIYKAARRAVKYHKPVLMVNVRMTSGELMNFYAVASLEAVENGTVLLSYVYNRKAYDISVYYTDNIVPVSTPIGGGAAMAKPATAPEIMDAPMIAEEPEKVLPEQTVKAVKPRKAPTKAIPEQKIETEV